MTRQSHCPNFFLELSWFDLHMTPAEHRQQHRQETQPVQQPQRYDAEEHPKKDSEDFGGGHGDDTHPEKSAET